jgi:hypothetical protein
MHIRTLALAAAAVLTAGAASAQTSATAQTVVAAEVPTILSIAVDRPYAEFPTVGLAELRQGYVDLALPIMVSHTSNSYHFVAANSGGKAVMTAGAIGAGGGRSGRPDKPVSDLTLSVGPTGYDVMTGHPLSGASGAAGTSVRANVPPGDYSTYNAAATRVFVRLALDITRDTEGRYYVPIIFNLWPS